MPAEPKINDAVIDAIVDMAKQGYSKRKIAKECGFNRLTLYRYLDYGQADPYYPGQAIDPDTLRLCKRLQVEYADAEKDFSERVESKLTPEMQAACVKHARNGLHDKTIADLVGVHVATLQKWLHWGDEDNDHIKNEGRRQLYQKFRAAILEARGLAEDDAVSKVRAEDPKFFLERRYPERWGIVHKIRVETERKVNEELEAVVDRLKAALTPEEYAKALEAIASDPDSED